MRISRTILKKSNRVLGVEALEHRQLLAVITWTGLSGTQLWNDPSNWNTGAVPTTIDDVTIGATAGTVLVNGSQSANSLNNAATLSIRGDSTFGGATLSVASTLEQTGTVRLTSIVDAWSSALNVGQLNNRVGGTIDVQSGTGGGRDILGPVNNQGTLSASTGVSINLNSLALINTGALNRTGSGKISFANGAARFNTGTTLNAPIFLQSTSIDVQQTTGSYTLVAQGSNTLVANRSSGVTIWVQGNSTLGGASLNVANADATNAGTLLLESIQDAWSSDLTTSLPARLINAGTVRAQAGSGGPRNISGSIVNSGLIEAVGASASLSGIVELSGGRVGETVRFANVKLAITASPVTPQTVALSGSTTLQTNILANYTLWLQGNDSFGGSYLNSATPFTNFGGIRMESVDSTYESNITASGKLLNRGLIQINSGAGGARTLSGEFENAIGGTLTVAANTNLQVTSGALPFIMSNGAMQVDEAGRMTISHALFSYTGGTVNGPLHVNGSIVTIESTVPAATLRLEGQNTLIRNSSTNVTLWVQGNGVYGGSYLYADENAINRGTIRLESIDSGFESRIFTEYNNLTFTLTNTATGVITSGVGAGGYRGVSGTLINQGQMTSDVPNGMQILGTYDAAGGVANENVQFANVNLRITASYLLPTRLILSGTTTLLTDVAQNMELWVQGNGLFGGGYLNATVPVINNGTIRLESISSAFDSRLSTSETVASFTNNGVINVEPGSGGPRGINIAGNFDGTGQTLINQGTDVTADRIRQGTFTALADSAITIAPGGTDTSTSRFNSFSITNGSRFNLNDNAFAIDYTGASPIASIRQKLLLGYNGGFWNNFQGIVTNLADPSTGRTIGYSESSAAIGPTGGTFAGVAVDGTAVLVRFTIAGDSTLDRRVNFNDLVKLALNYNVSSGAGWSQGDFNYDSAVGFVDLVLLARFYNQQFSRTPIGRDSDLISLVN